MMWQKSRVTSKYYRFKHLFMFANTLPTHIHPQSRSSKLSSRFCIFSVFEFPAYLPTPTTTPFPKIKKPKNLNFPPPPPSNPQLSPLLVVFPDKKGFRIYHQPTNFFRVATLPTTVPSSSSAGWSRSAGAQTTPGETPHACSMVADAAPWYVVPVALAADAAVPCHVSWGGVIVGFGGGGREVLWVWGQWCWEWE